MINLKFKRYLDKYKKYAKTPESFAVLFMKEHLGTAKWIKIIDYDCDGYFDFNKPKFCFVKCSLFEKKIRPKYPAKSDFTSDDEYIQVCRAITWETAQRDISLQEEKGVRGTVKTAIIKKRLTNKKKMFVLRDYSLANYDQLQAELNKYGADAIEKIPETSKKYLYEYTQPTYNSRVIII